LRFRMTELALTVVPNPALLPNRKDAGLSFGEFPRLFQRV
jgi:hypothetical protein